MAVGRRGGRRWLVVGLAASLGLPVVPATPASAATSIGPSPTPQAAVAPAAATAADVVRIVFDGTTFDPFVTRVEPGTPLLFTNEGGFPITIEDDGGAFVLSPIPSGGGAAITLSDEVAVSYTETQSGASGRLLFGSAGLGAPEAEPVADHIPDAWAPFEPDDAYTEDPADGVRYSTSRLVIRFAAGTTVSQAEAVIARAGAVIIGGNSRVGTLTIAVAGGADHQAVRAARAQLSAEPAIEIAVRTRPGEVDALPSPVDYPSIFNWPQEPIPGVGVSGQEAAGFPQLWNFGEAIRRRSATTATNVTTAVLDMGFDVAHANVAHMPELEVCQVRLGDGSTICTPQSVVSVENRRNVTHGTHVAGIIGARPANGLGLQGANPTADMIALRWKGPAWEVLSRVLDLKEQGDPDFADVRLINMSAGWGYNPPGWAAARRTAKCGHGPNDDDTANAIWPCLPWNEDGTVQAAFDDGMLAKPVLQRAASLGVMLVVSAGNSTEPFCISDGELYAEVKDAGGNAVCPEGGRPLTDLELGVPSSKINSPFTAANHLWQPSWGPNPVIVVESLANDFDGFSTDRSSFSQTDGTFSAHGSHYSASWTLPDGEPHWEGKAGTSQAAPTVTGIISSMLALDPSMTVTEVRDAVASFDDTTDPLRGLDVAPRIDALGSMLAVDGGLLALLDVSDPSADGNRRVVYGPGGSIGAHDTESSTEHGYSTEPDGVVDLRDFRRVRDAWLQGCTSAGTPDCSVLTTVPVALDGGPDHPKRDLNFDGCVATNPPGETCPAPESLHPRFDFNGDGELSRTATHPVNVDGGQTELTDLEVMARLFEPDPTGEGWNADTADVALLLEGLLVSGDIEVALGGLLGAGATDVAITLRESDVDVFRRPLAASEESVVITAHADRPVEIVVQGVKDGSPFEYREAFDLDAGEDVRYDPCGVIRLEGSDSIVAFESTATVEATLVGCDAADLSGVDIDVIVTRATGSGDATVDSPIATGVNGSATTTFTSGLNPGIYTVTATADLPFEDGTTTPVESSLLIEVTEGYRYTTIVDQADGTLGSPSLNDGGTVVFTSRADPTGPYNQINRYRDGALTEIGATARSRTDATIDINSIDITNDDDVLFQGDNFGAGLPVNEIRQWAGEVNVRFPTAVRIFGETSFFTPIDMSDQPAGNANGDRIMPIQRAGEVGTRVAAYLNGSLAEGPQLGADWVRHADNGYTIGRADLWPVETNAGSTYFTSAMVIGDSNFGIGTDPDQAFLVPIAVQNAPDAVDPTEWTLLGGRPDISPSGDVVAFVGDRGDGPAVFVALRANDQGSFYPPVAITGPGRVGPPELGFDGATPRHLEIDTDADDHNEFVGVIHHQLGREGLDDDVATVAVSGFPDGPGTPYTGGLYTIDVALTGTGAVAASGVHPVVEFGDTRIGATAERIAWYRVLADDSTSTDPAEHQLAFWVDTPAGERIVRANWVGSGGAAAGPAPFASGLHTTSSAAPAALTNPAPALAFGSDPPGVPAIVVSDLTPEIGQVVTITNRSPQRGQYPTSLVYEFDGTTLAMQADDSDQLQFAAGDQTIEFTAEGVSTFVPFVVSPPPGIPPTADPGGPYDIESGDQLVLDASASTDTDGTIVLYEWDLDGDGEYDDASGPSPRIDYRDVEDLLCNGLCSNPPSGGISYDPIYLRVTDDEGHTDVATGGVNVTVVVKDFSVSLLPPNELINPGGSTTLRIDVGSVGGFRDPVDLDVISSIPDGYTITLASSRVTPPTSVNIIVRAPADAPEEAFDIQVRGASGALVHETSAVAETVFGLIPICYETLSGVVTDAVTGMPVPDMPVQLRGLGLTRSTTSGPDGSYSYADVQELRTFTVGAYPTDSYFQKQQNDQVRCGDPLTVDLEVVPIRSTIVRGQIVEGIPDPTDPSRGRAIAATNTPIADPDVLVGGWYTIGGAAGYYEHPVDLRQPDNRGFRSSVSAVAPGFWPRSIDDVWIEAGPAVTVDVPLVRACTSQVGAHGRVVDQDGNPMPDLTVRLGGSGGPNGFGYPLTRLLGTTTTDSDGYYAITPSETYLDVQNSTYRFEVYVTYGGTFRSGFQYGQCDATLDQPVDVEVTVPDQTEPVEHYASITGRVVDAVTGEPIENASVLGRRTDVDGRFTKDEIFVGTDQYTVRTDLQVVVVPPYEYYREVIDGVTIAGDTVTDLGDIPVVPVEFATIEGYVVDAITGVPLQYAQVTVNPDFGSPDRFLLSTDENGYYVRERVKLPAYNEPRTATIEAVRTQIDGKYFRELGGTIQLNPGESTRTDFVLTEICQNVTIRGYVVDAVTGDPIEGASVDTPVTWPVSTDEFGYYELTGLSAGSYNQPGAYLLTASAAGYYTQQKLVTVGCGSVVTVNFGADTGSGAVFGTVTDELGNPVEGAQVIAETGDSGTADAAGDYRIDDIPLGLDGLPTEYDVTAWHPDGRSLVLQATVTDGGETELDYVFPEPVEPPNVPPTAFDLTASVLAGESVDITLVGTDADGDALTLAVATPPATGNLTGIAPSLTYTADAEGEGDVTFTYTAFDGEDTSAPATVTITVVKPNTPPVADDLVASVVAGEPIPIVLTGSDADGDSLTFDVVDQPPVGSLTGSEPNLTYLAPSDFTGDVAFTYTAFDGEDTSSPATVTITVEPAPPNTPPEAYDISEIVTAGESVNIGLGGSDADGDPLTFAVVSEPAVGLLTGTEPDLTYQAPSDFVGEVTFTYTAFDGEDTSAPATVTILVEAAPGLATLYGTVTDDLGAPIDRAVVFTDAVDVVGFTEPDGSYLILDIPVPATGEPVDVLFTAWHPDGRQTSESAVLVADTATELNFVFPTDDGEPNTPPTADDLFVDVTAGESVAITLTGDDADGDPLTFEVVAPPVDGVLGGVEPDLVYEAPSDVVGEVTFTYVAFDGVDASAPATVTITVLEPPNTPPTADDLSVSVDAGSTVAITLTGDDADGDPLTFEVVSPPIVGTLSGDSPDLVYEAPGDGDGPVTFTFLVDDGTDRSSLATVTITIIAAPPDLPPVLDPIADVTMDEGDSTDVGVLAIDPDGDPITWSIVAGPSWVSLADGTDGTGTLTLAPTDDAVETVEVKACAAGLCDSTSLVVTVLNVAPELTIDAPAIALVGEVVSVAGSATDPGADEFSYQIDCGDGDGAFQPSPAFECVFVDPGPAAVAMRVVDDDGGEGTAETIIEVVAPRSLSVSAGNDGPQPWGTDVTLTASPEASGLDEPIVYRWDLDGDGSFDTAAAAAATVVTQYSTPGVWMATVEACSGESCATATTEVEIMRRPAALSDPAGGPVQYSDETTVVSTLSDAFDGTTLAGRDVTITVDGTAVGVVSDGAGAAATVWSADVGAGPIPLAASFLGDELYERADSDGVLEVVHEDATLMWLTPPATPAESYDVAVEIREDPDETLGDIERAAITFWLDEACDGSSVFAGTFPVIDGPIVGDGVGEVTATITGLERPGCVRIELTAADGGPNGYYTATPIEAAIADAADGHVTGGGRFDTADGWVSVGFVARQRDGVLHGHVAVVEHGSGVVQHRSVALTGLSFVEDDAGVTATISATFLRRTEGGWVETTLTLVALDGGRGRAHDSVWWDGGPPVIEGTFRGQVVVHR